MSKNRLRNFIPLIVAVSISVGIFISLAYINYASRRPKDNVNINFRAVKNVSDYKRKLNYLIDAINTQYVDTVDFNNMLETTIPKILTNLDPHSVYIPAKDLEDVNSELEGHFSGIGVEFRVVSDTVYINAVVKGGPSEKSGLMAGDRVVRVNDSLFVGEKVTNELVFKTFRGVAGTNIKISVKRDGEKELKDFVVVRGDVPRNTIEATYIINKNIGYIKIAKFGRTTYDEMINSLAELGYKGNRSLIIDLRGNGGGYMDVAIKMINEFLHKDSPIVYTEGLHYKRSSANANGMGSCKNIPLVVLIDEASASASEILAGAIQDNDRGIVIGRRSFGKGLVQQSIPFDDGSAMRLTVAKYYTPSGRSIQKPYKEDGKSSYDMDLLNRFKHGEFFHKDSIKQNTELKFYTKQGREVYGGGGIMPDIFVAEDTTGVTSYLTDVARQGLVQKFTFEYTQKHRAKLQKYTTTPLLVNYLKRQNLFDSFILYATKSGVKRRNILINRSRMLIERLLYGNIVYNMLGLQEHVAYQNKFDSTINKAIEIIEKDECFPKPPADKAKNEEQERD